MTILNTWVEKDFAIVASDSACSDGAGMKGPASKIFPLVHCNAVIGVRGMLLYGSAQLISFNVQGYTFDQLFDNMLDVVTSQHFNLRAIGAAKGVPEALITGQETVLVGWSEVRQRMVGRVVRQAHAAPVFESLDIDPSYISPWADDMGVADDQAMRDSTSMASCCQAQHELLESEFPGRGFSGGTIICAELNRDETRIRRIGELS